MFHEKSPKKYDNIGANTEMCCPSTLRMVSKIWYCKISPIFRFVSLHERNESAQKERCGRRFLRVAYRTQSPVPSKYRWVCEISPVVLLDLSSPALSHSSCLLPSASADRTRILQPNLDCLCELDKYCHLQINLDFKPPAEMRRTFVNPNTTVRNHPELLGNSY